LKINPDGTFKHDCISDEEKKAKYRSLSREVS
jgi:hypothetical protein